MLRSTFTRLIVLHAIQMQMIKNLSDAREWNERETHKASAQPPEKTK